MIPRIKADKRMAAVAPGGEGYARSRLKPHWFHYVLQSALAMIAVWVALVALSMNDLVVVVSCAATAFTVFTMPSSVTAQPRNVVGGTVVALLVGSCCAAIPVGTDLATLVVRAGTVGLATLVMTLSDTEHPPAAGTALAVVTSGYSVRLLLGVLLGVVIISLTQQMLRSHLRDLTGWHLVAERARRMQDRDSLDVMAFQKTKENR